MAAVSDDLLIRYDNTDGSATWPNIPAGTPWWASPAIVVRGPGGAGNVVVTDLSPADPSDATDPDYQAITVKVGNRGQLRPDVRVQLWVADFGVGMPWLGTLGGSGGVTLGPHQVPAGATVAAGTEVSFSTTWYPSSTAAGGTAARHVCLLANVYAPGDGAQVTTPPVQGFDILTNRHHAQHNTTLAPNADGTGEAGFQMMMGNAGEEGGAFVLEVVEDTAKRLTIADQRLVLASDWLAAAQEDLGKRFGILPPAERVRLRSEAGKGKRGLLTAKLDGGQQAPVSLHVEAAKSRKPFGIRRFTVTQRTPEGEVLDGARVLLATVPDDFVPTIFRSRGRA